MQTRICFSVSDLKKDKKSFCKTSENWFIVAISLKDLCISVVISLQSALKGATTIAVLALSERKAARIIKSMLLVLPTPVGN